jgi:hypothetical protein
MADERQRERRSRRPARHQPPGVCIPGRTDRVDPVPARGYTVGRRVAIGRELSYGAGNATHGRTSGWCREAPGVRAPQLLFRDRLRHPGGEPPQEVVQRRRDDARADIPHRVAEPLQPTSLVLVAGVRDPRVDHP